MLALIIGIALSYIAVKTVVVVYKYKHFYKRGTSRFIGVTFISVIAPSCAWILKLAHNGKIPPKDAYIFLASAIIGLVIFFWLNKKQIDDLYNN